MGSEKMSDSTQPSIKPSERATADKKDAPAVKPAEVLFVGAKDEQKFKLSSEMFLIHEVDDPGRAMEMLRKAQFELFILDDNLFKSDITGVVREIKRRIPLIPLLVLSNNSDLSYQMSIMEAGADDILIHSLPEDELHRRLSLMLKQHAHNLDLARRNRHLHSITLLSRRLHSATDPRSLILETIDLTCSTFGLYGMAIVLDEGDKVRLFAGIEGASDYRRLYESTVHAHKYDPFRRAMETGIVQIFKDITADWHYASIPVLPKAKSAIVLPLKYQDYTIGAIGVFGTQSHPLDHQDLVIFELFAAQFVVALQNVRHYETQHINVQSSQHLLRAWQRFITLNSFEDIAQTLREQIEEIPIVGQAIVWLYTSEFTGVDELTISAEEEDTRLIFDQLQEKGLISKLIDQFDERMQPLSLWLGRGQQNPLGPLYRVMHGQQLMVLPITDSARLIGGVITSASNNNQFSIEDVNLMESLTHAAGQALERITLVTAMREQTGRLEAILRSIYEGIFFVDDTGKVAFINPQFTELTGINPSEVLNRAPEELLKNLTARAADKERTNQQLTDAINNVAGADRTGEYPIAEIRMTNPDRHVYIEFVHIGDLRGEKGSWVGIIRDASRTGSGSTTTASGTSPALLLDNMAEYVRVPYSQVRSAVNTLLEKHNTYTPKERDMFIRQTERLVEQVGQLWDNFIETYTINSSGVAFNREENNAVDIVNHVLESRAFSKYRRQIRFEPPVRLPSVNVDALYLGRAVANILQNAITFSPIGAPVTINVEARGGEVLISVQDQGGGIPAEELEKVFEPFSHASNNPNEEGAGLGLYLCREFVMGQDGRVWIDSAPGRGTQVTIALPVADSMPVDYPAPPAYVEETSDFAYDESFRGGARVPSRAPQTIMVVEGRSRLVPFLRKRLEQQGYEVIPYRSGEDALRDLNMRRLDLILLDTNLVDGDGIQTCERIRRYSEVPVILMADEISEAQKVRGFEVGADDYIARPMSDDELMARVKAMFKRQQIPDRTRKPLDLGDLYVDFARREVFLNKKPVELTRIEYDLLHTLAINMDMVLTHKQLLEKVWGPEYQGETQYLWVNVSRLRRKLEPTGDSPRYIHNQPGIGYVFRKP